MNVKAVSACASPSWSTLIWETAPGWKSQVVMTAEGNSTGGLTAGFESMIGNVLPGFSADLNAYSSVMSSRVSSPGNLRLSALKWLDMVAPLVVIARTGGTAAGLVWARVRAAMACHGRRGAGGPLLLRDAPRGVRARAVGWPGFRCA